MRTRSGASLSRNRHAYRAAVRSGRSRSRGIAGGGGRDRARYRRAGLGRLRRRAGPGPDPGRDPRWKDRRPSPLRVPRKYPLEGPGARDGARSAGGRGARRSASSANRGRQGRRRGRTRPVPRGVPERPELLRFRSAFAAGATTTMRAHIRYTELDTEARATISRPILTDLLRRELRFDGLSMTDSLDMSGIADISIEDVVVTGLEAGVDAMMVTSGIERQLAAAEWIADRVRPERTAEALRRAIWFRERFGRTAPDTDFDDEPRRQVAREIAEASITHVGPALPRIDGALRVLYFEPTQASPVEELSTPSSILEAALRHHLGDRVMFSKNERVPRGPGPLVVCSTNAWFQPEQAGRVKELLAHVGVLCAVRSPYDAALVPNVPALLSYGDVPVSLEALAAVLAGKRQAEGRLPVQLP